MSPARRLIAGGKGEISPSSIIWASVFLPRGSEGVRCRKTGCLEGSARSSGPARRNRRPYHEGRFSDASAASSPPDRGPRRAMMPARGRSPPERRPHQRDAVPRGLRAQVCRRSSSGKRARSPASPRSGWMRVAQDAAPAPASVPPAPSSWTKALTPPPEMDARPLLTLRPLFRRLYRKALHLLPCLMRQDRRRDHVDDQSVSTSRLPGCGKDFLSSGAGARCEECSKTASLVEAFSAMIYGEGRRTAP